MTKINWLIPLVAGLLLLAGCEGDYAAWKPFKKSRTKTSTPDISAMAPAAPAQTTLAETRWLDAPDESATNAEENIWSVKVRIPAAGIAASEKLPRDVAGFSLASEPRAEVKAPSASARQAPPSPAAQESSDAWQALQTAMNTHDPKSATASTPAIPAANNSADQDGAKEPDEHPPYRPRPYRIRTGDTIDISIPDEAETRQQVPVQPDGRIRYLFDIEIIAAGKTYKELHDELVVKLKKYYRVPRVTVIGKNFAGNSVFVMGPVKSPGAYTINNNTRLLHVLARAGALGIVPSDVSLTLEAGTRTRSIADLDGAYIMRGKDKLPVNFETLITGIDHSLRNNPLLKADDFIFIPSTFGNEKKVYLTGFFNRPQVYRYTGKLTFLEAVMQAGGTTLDFTSTAGGSTTVIGTDIAQNRSILIVRLNGGKVMRADYEKIRKGQAKDIDLQDGDIVFIPERELAKKSRIITSVINEVLAPLKAVLDADGVRRDYKKRIF